MTLSRAAAETDAMHQEHDVETKLLYAAHSRKPLSLLMTVSVTIICGTAFWQFFPGLSLAAWLIALLSSSAFGYLEWWLFQRAAPKSANTLLWQRLFLAQATVGGSAWAVGPTLMMPGASGAEQAIFVGTLLSVCGVAMISVAEQRTAMQAFIAAAQLPPAISLWLSGDNTERLIAMVLVSGMVLMIIAGRKFHQAMREQLEAQSRMHAVFNTASDAVIGMDANGYITDWNLRAKTVFGWNKDEALGMSLEDTVIPKQHRETYRNSVARSLIIGTGPDINRRVEITALRRNKEEFPIELAITSLKTANTYYFTAFISDITERKYTEAELRISSIAFESQSGMIVTNANAVILRVNQAFTKLTGFNARDVLGKNPNMLSSGRHDKTFFQTMWDTLNLTGYWQGEIWNRRKNGLIIAEWLTISAVFAPDGSVTHYVGTFFDITENKDAVAEIHRLAYYDPLTHLPNRRLLQDRLSQELAAAARDGLYGAILFLDLDNFKTLNDIRGHSSGDHLLIEVARRLRTVVREGDIVGRLGGDEFVVLLADLSKDSKNATKLTKQIGEKILDVLAHPYYIDDYEFHCTASIGVRLFRDQETVEKLLRHADLAMYQAKTTGGKSLSFFDPSMQTAVTVRAELEKDLRHALEEQQFKLFFQSQVSSNGVIVGSEALLRWQHPLRGLVLPTEFISLAEKTSLILPIGQWVLEKACLQLKIWEQTAQTRHLQLAVNVSARQFRHPEFVEQVQQILQSNNINPGLLKLELTESLVLDNIHDAIHKMHALRKLGVRFSLDDFGTGYSSFSYLTQLPLDQLKIDQSFVHNIGIKSTDAIIVQTIIGMANNLGIDVIAEGVETEAQSFFLEQHGCPAYQGYLFSKPVPISEFEQLILSADDQ
ncbi:MAG: EAL domain-containing protein [Methylococcales bacterium]